MSGDGRLWLTMYDFADLGLFLTKRSRHIMKVVAASLGGGYFSLLSKIDKPVKRRLRPFKYQWYSKWWKTPTTRSWKYCGCRQIVWNVYAFLLLPQFFCGLNSGLFWRRDVHYYYFLSKRSTCKFGAPHHDNEARWHASMASLFQGANGAILVNTGCIIWSSSFHWAPTAAVHFSRYWATLVALHQIVLKTNKQTNKQYN